jgi:hypothetical protein
VSAWIVSKKHIDLMVKALTEGTRDGLTKPLRRNKQRLGQSLVTENLASIMSRYGRRYFENAAGQFEPAYCHEPYRHEDPRYSPTVSELRRALDCYCYQSSEHAGWAGSQVKRLLDRVLGRLPEAAINEDAPWGFDEFSIAFRAARLLPDGLALLRANYETVDLAARAALSDWLIEHDLLAEPLTGAITDYDFSFKL